MKYRIANFYKGKFGYPERYDYYEIQAWNTIYKHWYCISNGHLGIEFVKNECLLKGLNFNNIPQVYIEKGDYDGNNI